MGTESHVGKRPLLKALSLAAGAAIVGLPFRDFPTTRRIVGSALGKDIDCSRCVEPENSQYPYDAIVVPGGGLIQTPDGEWLPSTYGQWRLEAAVLKYQKGQAPHIVLLDGKAGFDQDQFANMKYLQRIAADRGVELQDGVVIAEDQISENTEGNFDQLKSTADRYGFRRFLVGTNAFHRKRATLFACRKGLSASSFSVEDALIEEDSGRQAGIEHVYASKEVRNHKIKEGLETASMIWDSNGALQTLARKALVLVRGHKTYRPAPQPDSNISVFVLQESPQTDAVSVAV